MHEKRLLHLQKKGFSPNVVYDIGPFQGFWSKNIHRIFPKSDFNLFEANEDNRIALSHQPFPFFIELLGDQESDVVFYCSKTPSTGESIFLEQTSFFSASQVVHRTVKMNTLFSIH